MRAWEHDVECHACSTMRTVRGLLSRLCAVQGRRQQKRAPQQAARKRGRGDSDEDDSMEEEEEEDSDDEPLPGLPCALWGGAAQRSTVMCGLGMCDG